MRFHTLDGRAIEKFQRARNDLIFDDRRDGGRRRRHLVEEAQQGLFALRSRYQLQDNCGNDAQHALGTNEEILECETSHIFDAFISGL